MTGYSSANRSRFRLGVRMKAGAIACATAGMLAAAWPLSAHHSFSAEFDAARQLKVTGEVSSVEWMNPHAWIHVSAQEVCERRGSGNLRDNSSEEEWACRTIAADEEAEWGFELASPNGLMRQGWTRNSLSLGEVVTIEGSRARDDSLNGNARTVLTAEGERLFAGSSQGTTP
ncbi:MAG: hypothetical protein JXB36_16265 [Gammaproteobacteria bacterium]|nr:hypothetical protein [Gammaproteobacteria bacterium]